MNERWMMVKLLIPKQIVAVVLTYAPQQALVEDLKDMFFKDLIALFSKSGENDLIILSGDHNEQVRKDVNSYSGIHWCFGYGVRNLEGERILEMGSALGMIVCNTFFKKHDT